MCLPLVAFTYLVANVLGQGQRLDAALLGKHVGQDPRGLLVVVHGTGCGFERSVGGCRLRRVGRSNREVSALAAS